MTATDLHVVPMSRSVDDLIPIHIPRAAYRLGIALVVVTAVAAGLTAFLPNVLTGTDVMNGSARGTAIVLLFVTVPVLLFGMSRTRGGSAAAALVWLGCAAHALYQSTLFLYATPFNDLFFVYVVMLSLSLASIIALLVSIDAGAFRAHVDPRLPAKPIAVFVWVVAVANAVLWVISAASGLGTDGSPSFLDGTGLTTNPIYIQDLAFWLPMMVVAAWWLWRRLDHAFVIVGGMLVMWMVESVTVAVDQYMGSHADPSSDVATMGGMWIFVVLGLITVVPLVAFFRHVDRPRKAA